MITLAITDLDGTLVDTQTANAQAYEKAFSEHGVTLTEKDHESITSMHFNDFVKHAAPHLSLEESHMIRQQKSLYYPDFFDTIRINTGLVALLATLQAQGIKIALATTASRVNAERVLEHTQLSHLFDYAVFGDDVTNPKPNPECFLQCLTWGNTLPEQTIIFEDSTIGIEAAHATGAHVITISTTWLR